MPKQQSEAELANFEFDDVLVLEDELEVDDEVDDEVDEDDEIHYYGSAYLDEIFMEED
ncbi:MAG: hypothetical protein KME43_21895 [Myxacorys chilensis ATA2-1-KO14]|jgi:hypothetical protein|nr:hypothetical protein [Myxacorys chilensis ATA2-1-KO14]